jgi:hypothetical protein
VVLVNKHLQNSYSGQLNQIEQIIRSEWKTPSVGCGFATFLSQTTKVALPTGCEYTLTTSDVLARIDEAPILSSLGYAITCNLINDRRILDAWTRGLGRLSLREPFTSDRASFVYRPFELLGICLGASTYTEIDSSISEWLRGVLNRLRQTSQSGATLDRLIWAWSASVLNLEWGRVHLPTLSDLTDTELCLAYWIDKLLHNILTDEHPPSEILTNEVVHRYALSHSFQYDVHLAFLSYTALHDCIINLVNEGVSQKSNKQRGRKMGVSSIHSDLKNALSSGNANVIVGAGISRSSAGLPSWSDTMKAAVAFLSERGVTAKSLTTVEPLMDDGLFEVAGQVVDSLMGSINGKAEFLRTQFHLTVDDIYNRGLVDAIWSIAGHVVFTTNYDRILELCGEPGVETITWQEPEKMVAALRGHSAVVHLHGVFNQPNSVVFSASDYTRLSVDSAYESFSRTLWTRGPFVFIGTSPFGMGDMDFSKVFAWGHRYFSDLPFVSYSLQRTGEISSELVRELYSKYKVIVVEYGDKYEDLEAFIRGLV